MASGHDLGDDVGQFADTIILLRLADIEGLVVNWPLAALPARRESAATMSRMCTIGRHGVPSLLMYTRPVVYADATRSFNTISRRKRGETP